VKLRLELPRAPLFVDADSLRVTQAISNLLDNAVKYGGEPPEVTLKMGCDKRDVFLRVLDNGEGVRASEQDSIFELFAQGEHSRGQGLGVGLWLSRKLAEHMGGALDLETLSGQTCFTLRLPASLPSVRAGRR